MWILLSSKDLNLSLEAAQWRDACLSERDQKSATKEIVKFALLNQLKLWNDFRREVHINLSLYRSLLVQSWFLISLGELSGDSSSRVNPRWVNCLVVSSGRNVRPAGVNDDTFWPKGGRLWWTDFTQWRPLKTSNPGSGRFCGHQTSMVMAALAGRFNPFELVWRLTNRGPDWLSRGRAILQARSLVLIRYY